MNYLDIILAIPLLWTIYRGFTKGFILSLASLLALLLGIYGAINFSDLLAAPINNLLHPDPKYLQIIAFAVAFILIVLIVHLIAFFLDRLVKAVALGFVNRMAGVLFNLIKMAFILSVIMSLLDYLGQHKSLIPQKDKEESVLYIPISKVAPFIFPYLNYDELKKKFPSVKPTEVPEDNLKPLT
jgi:membrane protein required for colicin V production